MPRISLTLMVVLFCFTSLLIAQEVHFYLYEYATDDGKAVIIFEVKSDNPTIPGPEFSEVTAVQLHEKGYLTPSESEMGADVIDEFEVPSPPQPLWSGSSWARGEYRQNNTRKWVECGSKTSRSLFEGPGPLFVACTTYRTLVYPSPGPRVPVFIREYTTWGYYTKIAYTQEYPAGIRYYWEQKGRHHIGNPSQMRYSSASLVF